MIVKDKLEEDYITISEVKEILNDEADERADDEREMAYELRLTIDYANEFAYLDADDANDLVEELLDLEAVDEFIAHKIADMMPDDKDQVRAIYAKERYSLDTDELDEIVNTVAKYR